MSHSSDYDYIDHEAQKSDDGTELELDECILVDWSDPKEKSKFTYHSPKSNTFTICIKSTNPRCIPVKFTLERAKAPQTFRLFASVTNNFTNEIAKKHVDTVLSGAHPTDTVDLPIGPFDVIDDGWAVEGMLCIVIKIYRLKKGIKIQAKEQKERKRKSKHEDSDGDFEVSEMEKFSATSASISSRAQDSKLQKQQRMNLFLENQILMGDDGIAAPYCGLLNLGATCYMNSFLQVLYHIPYFRKLIYSINTSADTKGESIVFNLQKLFALMEMSPDAVSTEDLTRSFGWNEAETNVQHDIEEFSRVLMESIKEKLKDTSEASEIEKMFTGTQIHEINLPKVSKSIVNSENFEDLQLLVKGCNDIYSSFQHFISPQKIDEYKTEQYGKQKALFRTLFSHLPDVLVLHLQRFEYDPTSQNMVKINSRYQFETEIDMKDFMDGSSDESTEFTLTGVIVHSGNPIGGHYYSYLKTKNDAQWYLFNDSSVRTATEEKAVQTNYGGTGTINDGPFYGKPKTYSAYMLVYIRTTELERIFAPTTSHSIPDNIVEVVREFRRQEEERRLLETTVKFSLFTEDFIARSVVEYVNPFNAKKYHPHPLTLQTTDMVGDLFCAAASVLQCDVKNVVIRHLAIDSIVGVLQNNEAPIQVMPTSRIFAHKMHMAPTKSMHMYFLVLYDKSSPKQPFKYICHIMPLNQKEKLCQAIQRFCEIHEIIFKTQPSIYGYRLEKNQYMKLDMQVSFKSQKLKDFSYIFLMPDDKNSIIFPDGLPVSIPDDESENIFHYYQIFPKEMPDTPDKAFQELSQTLKFQVVENLTEKVLANCVVPSSISLSQLKAFLCHICEIDYDEDEHYCFIYRDDDIKPVQESSSSLAKLFVFKYSPAVNRVSIVVIDKDKCPRMERNLRIITYFSEDAVRVSEPTIQLHNYDATISNFIEHNKTVRKVPDGKQIRVCNMRNNKIMKLYKLKDNLRDLVNPLRLEIVPDDQMNIEQSVFIRVSSLGPDTKDYFNDPFFFLVKQKETFEETKKRLQEYTKIPEETFQTLAFKIKTQNDYGLITVEDNMELWKTMSLNDRLFIVFPGAPDFPVKRRAQLVSQTLKINK